MFVLYEFSKLISISIDTDMNPEDIAPVCFIEMFCKVWRDICAISQAHKFNIHFCFNAV